MTLYRVLDEHGHEVAPGDTITDFRGEPMVLKGIGRAPDFGRSGKVYVDGRLGWFNDSVFRLQIWRRVEDSVAGRCWLVKYVSPDVALCEYDDGQRYEVRVSELLETEEL